MSSGGERPSRKWSLGELKFILDSGTRNPGGNLRSERALFGGQAHRGEPEGAHRIDHIHVLIEVRGLRDEAIGVLVVRGGNIFEVFRRGHHDHRNAAQEGIGFDLRENLMSAFFRKVEVQEDDSGNARIFVGRLLAHVVERRLAIGHDMKIVRNFSLLEDLNHELNISLVVFDQKDVDDGATFRCDLVACGHCWRCLLCGGSDFKNNRDDSLRLASLSPWVEHASIHVGTGSMMPICKEILIIKYGDPEADQLELLEDPALAKSVQVELAEDVEGGHEELFTFEAVFVLVSERRDDDEILEKLEEVSVTLPVILILSEFDQDFENAALPTGAQDCLFIPELDSNTLLRSLHHAIARNRNRLGMKLAESEQRLQAFRESQAFYHSLVETLTQGVSRKDRQGSFTFVNENVCRHMAQSPAELLGKTDFDFFPEELARKYHEDDMAVIESGKGTDGIEGFETAGGQRLVVRTIKTPVYNPDGEVIGLQGIF